MPSRRQRAGTVQPRAVAEHDKTSWRLTRLFVLLSSPGLAVLSTAAVGAVLPVLQESFPDSPGWKVALVFTSPALSLALGSPVAGYVADFFGRKNLFLLSMLLYAVLGTVPLYVENLDVIVISRLLTGFSTAGLMTASTALMADYTTAAQRATYIGWQSAGVQLWGLVGLILGGALVDISGGSYKGPFWLFLIPVLFFIAGLLSIFEPTRDGSEVVYTSGNLWATLPVQSEAPSTSSVKNVESHEYLSPLAGAYMSAASIGESAYASQVIVDDAYYESGPIDMPLTESKSVPSGSSMALYLIPLTAFAMRFIVYAYVTQKPFLLRQLDPTLSLTLIGAILVTKTITGFFASMALGWLHRQLSHTGLVVLFSMIIATGVMLSMSAEDLIGASVACSIFGIGAGPVTGAMMSWTVAIAPMASRGRAVALTGFAMALGQFSGSIVSSFFVDAYETLYAGFFVSLFSVAGLIALYVILIFAPNKFSLVPNTGADLPVVKAS